MTAPPKRKNPLHCEAGSSIYRADDNGIDSSETLYLQCKPKALIVSLSKDGPFFWVLIDPPIPARHSIRRPQTFASLAFAKREAAIIAKIIGGIVVPNADRHG